tara:strand:+ start:41 stop:214 length:174 start_codon:yes stop_codon:yes gene_type:complete
MMKEQKKIEVILYESIQDGKSSYEVGKQLDVPPTTVRRWASNIGLKFKGKSKWMWNK